MFFTGAAIRWWAGCYGREVGENNGSAISLPATSFPEEVGGSGTQDGGGKGYCGVRNCIYNYWLLLYIVSYS